jgi:hypothetical protein
MTNYERQRLFRERHPGYYNKYNARQRQQTEQVKQKMAALSRAAIEAELAAQAAAAAAAAAPATTQLMLPAPAEPLIIPGMNTLEGIRQHDAQAVAIARE